MILGMWVILVTAVATYAGVVVGRSPANPEKAVAEDLGTEELKTEMTSIPVLRGGDIVGYVIIQVSFQADRKLLGTMTAEPEAYLVDAAFRVIFASEAVDFQRLRGSDLDRITAEIAEAANARLGQPLVRAVLIQQLNYVRREDIRTNWIKSGGAQAGHGQ